MISHVETTALFEPTKYIIRGSTTTITMTMLPSKHHVTTGGLLATTLAFISIVGVSAQTDSFSSSARVSCFGGNGALVNKTYGDWRNSIIGTSDMSPIFERSEFENFIDPDAIGSLGSFGHCARLINGNLLGLAYICQNKTGTEDCLCLAEYNGTACTSCTPCDASAPATSTNFQADCTNVNGACKIECGQADGTLQESGNALITEATMDVCPYPASSGSTGPGSSPASPSAPAPAPTSNGGMQQQLKSTCLALSVLVTTLFWFH
jgi:hypothetical protein